jgi:hypothetical protein
MRTMMKSFRVSSEDLFPTLGDEAEAPESVAADPGPAIQPESVVFRPRTEEPSVAELYITSGSSKCCHLELADLDGRAFHSVVRLGSKVLVYGGRLPDGNISKDILLVDPGLLSTRAFSPMPSGALMLLQLVAPLGKSRSPAAFLCPDMVCGIPLA